MSLKSAARRSVLVNEAYFMLKNALAGMRGGFTDRTRDFRQQGDPLQRADYALSVFERYLSLAGLSRDDLHDIRVLEIGPGDSLGVAFLFAAHGATVHTTDAFHVHRPKDADEATGRLLLERLGMDPAGAADTLARVEAHYGLPIELAVCEGGLPAASFDLVASNAVLQHVRDVVAALEQIDALLVEGGRHVHAVDLRDMGTFTGGGLHELTFLGVPEPRWRRMSENLALPNRMRISCYRETLDRLGHESRFWVSRLLGEPAPLDPPRSLEEILAGQPSGRTIRAMEEAPPDVQRALEFSSLEDWMVQVFAVSARKA